MCKISSYVVAATVLVALALCPVAAKADIFSFELTFATTQTGSGTPNFATLFPGPYALVTVTTPTLNSNMATITFDSSSFGSGGHTYYMGDGGAAALNVNASSFNVGITGGPTGSDPGWNNILPVVHLGGIGVDGTNFGNFNLRIDNTCTGCDGGYNAGLVQTLSFTLTNTGTTWADAAAVLVANGSGFDAESHITAEGGSCAPGATTLCHGYAGNSVPEPPVNALLACSALLFGGLFLRRPLWS